MTAVRRRRRHGFRDRRSVVVEGERAVEVGEVVQPTTRAAPRLRASPACRAVVRREPATRTCAPARRDVRRRARPAAGTGAAIASASAACRCVWCGPSGSTESRKLVFLFTAEGGSISATWSATRRRQFRTRVEMRQIGVRDEAGDRAAVTDPCGRALCCSTFLKGFPPISIKMAKAQKLSLNPSKLSGMCGAAQVLPALRVRSTRWRDRPASRGRAAAARRQPRRGRVPGVAGGLSRPGASRYSSDRAARRRSVVPPAQPAPHRDPSRGRPWNASRAAARRVVQPSAIRCEHLVGQRPRGPPGHREPAGGRRRGRRAPLPRRLVGARARTRRPQQREFAADGARVSSRAGRSAGRSRYSSWIFVISRPRRSLGDRPRTSAHVGERLEDAMRGFEEDQRVSARRASDASIRRRSPLAVRQEADHGERTASRIR